MADQHLRGSAGCAAVTVSGISLPGSLRKADLVISLVNRDDYISRFKMLKWGRVAGLN